MEPKVGLVGAGMWGKNHLRVLRELGVLHMVCDTNPAFLKNIQAQDASLKTSLNIDELLSSPDIQAVFIATPAATHHALVKRAIQAGKDVFVEKPLALIADHGEELVTLAKKQKRILMVGHLLHYHPAIQMLKELVARGDLGDLRYIASNRLNFGKFRIEENVLWSFAPHDVSLMLAFYKSMPEHVHVQGATFLQKNIPDTTLSFFDFPKNRKAHIFVSWLYPFKEQRFVLVGEKNMAVFDDQAKEKLVVYQNEVTWDEGKPTAKRNGEIVFRLPEGEPLIAQAKHFLECVKTRKPPLTDGEEGLRVLKVLEMCEDSFSEVPSV